MPIKRYSIRVMLVATVAIAAMLAHRSSVVRSHYGAIEKLTSRGASFAVSFVDPIGPWNTPSVEDLVQSIPQDHDVSRMSAFDRFMRLVCFRGVRVQNTTVTERDIELIGDLVGVAAVGFDSVEIYPDALGGLPDSIESVNLSGPEIGIEHVQKILMARPELGSLTVDSPMISESDVREFVKNHPNCYFFVNDFHCHFDGDKFIAEPVPSLFQ